MIFSYPGFLHFTALRFVKRSTLLATIARKTISYSQPQCRMEPHVLVIGCWLALESTSCRNQWKDCLELFRERANHGLQWTCECVQGSRPKARTTAEDEPTTSSESEHEVLAELESDESERNWRNVKYKNEYWWRSRARRSMYLLSLHIFEVYYSWNGLAWPSKAARDMRLSLTFPL